MTEPLLETERLILRPRVLADLDANMEMDRDPDVNRFIWGDSPPDWKAHREELIRRISSDWPSEGGLWAVERKTQPGFIGWCGLFPLEDSGFIEIGYRYSRAAWGQGIATEAAQKILEHGFERLNIDPIVAVTHPDNVRSQHVLKKIGLRRVGMAFHYGRNLSFFRLDAVDYRALGTDSSA
ncbi:MAG: GNAT family N-acetyltransferase [Rhodospirillales bacterium]|nr:GNAT family N-acetyltransferase [Rhodospirillales bacterium]